MTLPGEGDAERFGGLRIMPKTTSNIRAGLDVFEALAKTA